MTRNDVIGLFTNASVLARNSSAICGEIENSKFEARNPKQYPMVQIQMTKTVGLWVSVLNIGALEF
jgi:hypothetical protein